MRDTTHHPKILVLAGSARLDSVNRKPVRDASDFESAMRDAKDATLLLVNRQGSTMYLAV